MEAWAVVENGKPLQKIRLPRPVPQGSEVLIQVTHSGICHTDLHFWEGFYDLGGGKKFHMTDRGCKLPCAMGHEVLGIVAQLGSQAQGVALGDRRIVFPWIGCGDCWRCETGDENLCDKPQSIGILQNGGMADYVLVKHPKYLVDPGELDPAVAATFGCSGVTVMSAIEKMYPMAPDAPIVLIGAGGLGLAAVSLLKALGFSKLISVDPQPQSREAALQAGATAAIDPKSGDARQKLVDVAGGPISSVMDLVNNSETAALAFSLLCKGGKMVQVGLIGGELNMSLVGLVAKAATVIGNSTGTIKHLERITELARFGNLAPVPVTLMQKDRANEALLMLKGGKVTGRLILIQ